MKWIFHPIMSYVAEWQGGGPQDLLRQFESVRNC